jgi:predicted RNA-binding Zn ribbon-like protein
VVQAFINSHYDLELEHGADLFATPASLTAWLERHGVADAAAKLTDADVCRAVTLRESLRALAADPASAPLVELNGAAAGAALELRFDAGGPHLVPVGPTPLDRIVGSVLAITAQAIADGSWARLKICPGEDCGWAFFDSSRNLSGRWCSMRVCGGRAKARAHYRRQRQAGR